MYAAAPSLVTPPPTTGTTVTNTVTSTTSVGAGATVTATVTAGGATVTQTLTSTAISTVEGGGLSGTIAIGNLVSLSGSLASYGQRSKVAVDLAIADVNDWLKVSGYGVQFKVNHEDTATDPAVALQKLQTLAAQGVKIYVGPMTSGEARNIISYANSNNLVLISQSSTAEDMGIPNDYLFRLVPTDFAQSKALAALIWDSGVRSVVIVQRHDTWGDGLTAALVSFYEDLGGNVVDVIQYDPNTADFSPILATVNTDYNNAVSQYGAGATAIVAVSFDELANIYQQVNSYPDLLQSVWFGSDGTAQSSTVASTAGSIAAQVKSLSTIYAPTRSEKYASFTARVTQQTGGAPDAYAYAAYDATWVAALSILSAGKNDGAAVAKLLPGVANNYYGVAGWPDLNANGDRTISDYDIWQVVTSGGTASWVQIGTWSSSTGKVAFTVQP